tara:strand:+ start:88 stop:357 length:270 start_codon:yes stop_codon:yes gene_type:complete
MPAAVEQAQEVRTFRKAEGDSGAVLQAAVQATEDGPVPPEAASEMGQLATEYADVSERQRALTREYQTLRGQRSPEGDVDLDDQGEDPA